MSRIKERYDQTGNTREAVGYGLGCTGSIITGAAAITMVTASIPQMPGEGAVTEYALHEGLVDSLFRPGATNRASVAHFMCELATDSELWAAWRGRLPVIVNAAPA